MDIQVTALSVLTLLSALVTTWLAAYGWQRRDEPGARTFTGMAIGAAVWTMAYGIALAVFQPAVRSALEAPILLGLVTVPIAWVVFALEYTGRGAHVTKRRLIAIAIVPATTVVLAVTKSYHSLLWSDYRIQETLGAATTAFDPGPWLLLQAVVSYALVVAGTAVLVEPAVSDGIYQRRAATLVGGTVGIAVVNLKRLFVVGPYPLLDLTPIAIAVVGVVYARVLFGDEPFTGMPATRRIGTQAAVDDFGDGIVIVDTGGEVVDANVAAASVLGRKPAAALGEPVADLLGVETDGFETTPGERTVRVPTEAGDRQYTVTVSAVEDRHERPIGYTLIFHDVTQQVRRKQRLSVLNRVLRHNLRNDMTVVMGAAERLADRLDGPDSEDARRIERRADDLVALGEKAREVEEVMEWVGDRPEEFDVGGVVRAVADTARERYPEATVEVSVEADGRLAAVSYGRVFETVVDNVVDNAGRHVDAPTIEIELRVDDDDLLVVIADDGPGVPESELAAVGSKETPLQHGSGLGLWLIRWGTTALGGTVEFDVGDGTRVELAVPRYLTDEARIVPATDVEPEAVGAATPETPPIAAQTDGGSLGDDASPDGDAGDRPG
ncbi:HTR-like protein [Halobacteriales archaeon SW_7_68_16]|nr:MAG: HTR-like protein [Halobacteriales archaeon SW_7_68_16]